MEREHNDMKKLNKAGETSFEDHSRRRMDTRSICSTSYDVYVGCLLLPFFFPIVGAKDLSKIDTRET
jgi:hypothetical protein